MLQQREITGQNIIHNKHSGATMLYAATQRYVTKMLTGVSGPKAIIFDSFTLEVVSLAVSRSELLTHEVFSISKMQRIKKKNTSPEFEEKKYLKAIYFVQPTTENVLLLAQELRMPSFMSYHIYFSSYIETSQLEKLARSDSLRTVEHIEIFFCDFQVLSPEVFSLQLPTCHLLMFTENLQYSLYEALLFEQIISGVASVILGGCQAFCDDIYFQICSDISRCLASRLQQYLKDRQSDLAESAFMNDNKKQKKTCVVFFDRRADPLTPLLNQWTYEAMTHELLGIHNNVVTIGPTSENTSSNQIVLSPLHDSFYSKYQHSNFGELGKAVCTYVEDFQRQVESVNPKKFRALEARPSLKELQEYVKSYPEFRQTSISVSNHVQLVHTLSRIVESKHLYKVSALEQELITKTGTSSVAHMQAILDLAVQYDIPKYELLRLSLLFVLCYQECVNVVKEFEQLIESLQPEIDTALINNLLAYYQSVTTARHHSELFQKQQSLLQLAKSAIQGTIPENNNIYTQHQSYLSKILEHFILKGKFKDTARYTQLSNLTPQTSFNNSSDTDIIVFIIGGATYKESLDLATISNKTNRRVILGGTTFHNSKSFLAEVALLNKNVCSNDIITKTNTQTQSVQFDNREIELEQKKKFLYEGW